MKKFLILLLFIFSCLGLVSQESSRPTEGNANLPGDGVSVSSSILYDFMNTAGIENLKTVVFAGVDKIIHTNGKNVFRLRTGPSFYSAKINSNISDSIKSLLNPGYVNLTVQPSYTYQFIPKEYELSIYLGIGAKGNVYDYIDASSNEKRDALFSASAKMGIGLIAFKYGGLIMAYKISNDCIYPNIVSYSTVFGTSNPWNGSFLANLSAYMPQTSSYFFCEYRALIHGDIFSLYGSSPILSLGIRQDLDISGIMTSFR